MRLSRRTLLEIHRRTTNRQAALTNPQAFAVAAVNIIKEKLADQLVSGIRYEKNGDWFEMSQFADMISSYADRVVKSDASSKGGGTHLYDGVPIDSETVERPFAAMLENRLDVKLYIKLPRWFEVDTPVGKYNPDWAVVMDDPERDGDTLYLVRETKGGESLDDLRPAERRKIACGLAHFDGALGVDFDVIRPPFGPTSLA